MWALRPKERSRWKIKQLEAKYEHRMDKTEGLDRMKQPAAVVKRYEIKRWGPARIAACPEADESRSSVVGTAKVGESLLRAWRRRVPGSSRRGAGIAHVFVRPGLVRV